MDGLFYIASALLITALIVGTSWKRHSAIHNINTASAALSLLGLLVFIFYATLVMGTEGRESDVEAMVAGAILMLFGFLVYEFGTAVLDTAQAETRKKLAAQRSH